MRGIEGQIERERGGGGERKEKKGAREREGTNEATKTTDASFS